MSCDEGKNTCSCSANAILLLISCSVTDSGHYQWVDLGINHKIIINNNYLQFCGHKIRYHRSQPLINHAHKILAILIRVAESLEIRLKSN